MSVIKVVTIACDHPDCADDDEASTAFGPYESAAAIRHAAKAKGWTQPKRGGKDFCPKHSDG